MILNDVAMMIGRRVTRYTVTRAHPMTRGGELDSGSQEEMSTTAT